MYRALILSLIIASTPGCAILSWFTDDEPDNSVLIHPDMPRPIQQRSVDWHVIEHDDRVLIATEYPEFLNHLELQQDISRYIQQLINTTCYYRKDLKEDQCQLTSDE